jgi:Kef-type K+ transport system membrane component KefB
MRRALILVLLLGGVRLVLPLGTGAKAPYALLTLGFLMLAAYTVAEIASAMKLPRVVGYLLAGIVFGPALANIVTVEASSTLAPVTSLAISLIAFLAGAELRWSEVRDRVPAIGKILFAELTLTLLLLLGLLLGLRQFLPFTGPGWTETFVFSLLFASMAIVHSPAVTLAILSETGARGPVARTVLGTVLLSDVFVVLVFSATLSLAQALAPPAGFGAAVTAGAVAWELLGAVVVGAALGGAVSLYLRFVQKELFLFALLVTFLGAEVARMLHVEVLLTLLTAGFIMENVSRKESGLALRHAMERAAAPVFVVFFALAGASMHLDEFLALWPLVIPIVLVRAFGIRFGSLLGARWARLPRHEARNVWTGLVSQAGVAIGLASVVAEVYPARGAALRNLFLAVIAVNELIGPILFKRGLAAAGEIPATSPAPPENPVPAPAT